MKRAISITILIILILTGFTISRTQIIYSSKLTIADLQNRKGNIIIEKCIGTVTDLNGNGEVLNCTNPDYSYISYSNTKANIGDIVLTYFVYNPVNNVEDDIIFRFDFIL